jgi:hypothetical protein
MRKDLDGNESQMKGATVKGQGRVCITWSRRWSLASRTQTLVFRYALGSLFRPLRVVYLTYLAFGALRLASPKGSSRNLTYLEI